MLDYEDILAMNMFFQYCGNFEQMARDGVYEQYKSYGAPKEYEPSWARELGEKLLSELSVEDAETLTKLEVLAWNYEGESLLEGLVTFVRKNSDMGDAYIRMRYAETIIRLMGVRGKHQLREQLLTAGVSMAEALVYGALKNPGSQYPGQSEHIKERADEVLRKIRAWFQPVELR